MFCCKIQRQVYFSIMKIQIMLYYERSLCLKEILLCLLQDYGYIALLFLMILENVFPPIPSELILAFCGFMISKNYFSILGVIAVSTFGAYIGSFVLYFIGRMKISEILLQKLHFSTYHIQQTKDWFDKQGKKAVFLGRFVPIIRSIISLPAGMVKMSMTLFSLYTLLGTLCWNSIVTFIGFYLGENWYYISVIFQKYNFFFVILFVIGFYCYKKKRT